MLGHPAWSLLSRRISSPSPDALQRKSTGDLEAYGGRGDSSILCDIAAAQGYRGSCSAWTTRISMTRTCSKAGLFCLPSRKTGDLLESLRSGRFYASEGPDIRQVTIEDGVVTAETSPVSGSAFYRYLLEGGPPDTRPRLDHGLLYARPARPLHPCRGTDAAGKRATTQYFSSPAKPQLCNGANAGRSPCRLGSLCLQPPKRLPPTKRRQTVWGTERFFFYQPAAWRALDGQPAV